MLKHQQPWRRRIQTVLHSILGGWLSCWVWSTSVGVSDIHCRYLGRSCLVEHDTDWPEKPLGKVQVIIVLIRSWPRHELVTCSTGRQWRSRCSLNRVAEVRTVRGEQECAMLDSCFPLRVKSNREVLIHVCGYHPSEWRDLYLPWHVDMLGQV